MTQLGLSKRELTKVEKLRVLKVAYDLIRTDQEEVLIEAYVAALEKVLETVADEA